jgi:hypothetical protein
MSVTRRGLRNMPQYESMSVKAGILEGATYPAAVLRNAATGEEMPDPREGMHVATIAAALEYGHGQAKPRPFMQTTARTKRNAWGDAIVKLVAGGASFAEALATVGQVMKEDIRFTITEWPADNSESWAAFKGFNHGLVQTSHLLNSVEFEVES